MSDDQIDQLRRIYNDTYCEQRREGVRGGDAERVAMRAVVAEVAAVLKLKED